MKNLFHDKNFGLLVLRVVVGIVFVMHGYQKFGSIDMVSGFFASLGLGASMAYVVATIELVGGISLILGYGSKIAAGLLAIVMAGAIIKVHGANGFFLGQAPGYEFVLTLLGASVAILYTGAGKYGLGSDCGCPCSKGTCPIENSK